MPDPTDPHSQVRMTVQPCELHHRHMPETHLNHRHHIWPLGEGGPDIQDNIVVVCPTGHTNMHCLLKEYKTHMGNVPYTVIRTYSVEERKYAELGWKRMNRGSM